VSAFFLLRLLPVLDLICVYRRPISRLTIMVDYWPIISHNPTTGSGACRATARLMLGGTGLKKE